MRHAARCRDRSKVAILERIIGRFVTQKSPQLTRPTRSRRWALDEIQFAPTPGWRAESRARIAGLRDRSLKPGRRATGRTGPPPRAGTGRVGLRRKTQEQLSGGEGRIRTHAPGSSPDKALSRRLRDGHFAPSPGLVSRLLWKSVGGGRPPDVEPAGHPRDGLAGDVLEFPPEAIGLPQERYACRRRR